MSHTVHSDLSRSCNEMTDKTPSRTSIQLTTPQSDAGAQLPRRGPADSKRRLKVADAPAIQSKELGDLTVLTSSEGAFAAALSRLERFAGTDEPVVLHGESGTGKTHLAHWLHAASRRAAGPMHCVNMAGLDDSIASAELFGHVPGAYTDARGYRPGAFASAMGGTLLMDEIGKASLDVQQKLLDVIERRTFQPLGSDRKVAANVRLVFTFNEEMDDLVSSGRMLRDFLPRLGLFRVRIPPLRERRDDIPYLIRHLIDSHASRFGWKGSHRPEPTDQLLSELTAYAWPDNVREMDSLVRRLLVDARGSRRLDVDLLVEDLAKYRALPDTDVRKRPLSAQDIATVIERCGGNKSKAARILGIGRTSIYRLTSGASPDPDNTFDGVGSVA